MTRTSFYLDVFLQSFFEGGWALTLAVIAVCATMLYIDRKNHAKD